MREFNSQNLPTKREVLRFVSSLFYVEKLKKRECLLETAKKVDFVWKEKGLDPQLVYRAADKINILLNEYIEMRKRYSRDGVRLRQRRQDYLNGLNGVFDISKSNRTIDLNLKTPINVNTATSNQLVERRALHQIARSSTMSTNCVMDQSFDDTLQQSSDQIQEVEKISNISSTEMLEQTGRNRANRALRNREPETKEVAKLKPDKKTCLVMDRIGLSNEFGSLMFLTIADQLGFKKDQVICSTSTIFRLRKQHREDESLIIKQTFDRKDMHVIHWDGKTP